MKEWSAQRIARASAAGLVRPARSEAGPVRAVVDSRAVRAGDLFVGIRGDHDDGGRFAAAALHDGAWGVLVTPEHARDLPGEGAVLATRDPISALGRLARAWREELGCRVIGITGSTGKTSTKEILAGLLQPQVPTLASRANFNTEIGLPLNVLAAEPGVEVLVLELAMRGAGQIAELADIARPNVGVVVNVGPVHLELLGSLQAIAAAKAELIVGLEPGGTAVVPAGDELLAPHLRDDVRTLGFGAGGDVRLVAQEGAEVVVDALGDRLELEVPFTQAYHRDNLLAAVAAAVAIGIRPSGRFDVAFSPLRGERVELADGTVVLNDCYNANPMSMRAALDELASAEGTRRVAVLGDMLELGPDELVYHEEVGREAAAGGVDVLVTVGPRAVAIGEAFAGQTYAVADAVEAAGILPELLEPGDVVLVKGSRGVGLEVVAEALRERVEA
jgi:UDP-N-acetylmuramoyl-tripeptide--D-alanyl-D-alanine ligase